MGWVRIEDSLLNHPAFNDDDERMKWVRMIHRAAREEITVRYRGRLIFLLPGQFAMTLRDMAKLFSWSKSKTERFLKRLEIGTNAETENEPMISVSNETGVNVITICNYYKYQISFKSNRTQNKHENETVKETQSGTSAGHKRDTSGTRKETNKQINNNIPPTPHTKAKEVKRIAKAEKSQTEIAYAEYCKLAKGLDLPVPRGLSAKRKTAIGLRLGEHGIDVWGEALSKIRGSPMLRGDNPRAWCVSLDWLTNPSNFMKVIEGNYDAKSSSNPFRNGSSRGGQEDAGVVSFMRELANTQPDSVGGWRARNASEFQQSGAGDDGSAPVIDLDATDVTQ